MSPFDLPDRLSAKRDPALIAADESHFARIERSIQNTVASLSRRLSDAQLTHADEKGEAVERDMEVRRLASRLATFERYGLDLCLGRMVTGSETIYIGRLGLTDDEGSRLLVDWRSPAAEPFFAATLAQPHGLLSRRRYRWTGRRITDYWDEAFGDVEISAALDDESAFIASLGASRSPRMRDVLGTLQADQDAIIRAGSRGALVVDGGPGTGKTVVALHRAAYLLYSDPRLARHHGGVLFVGPSGTYLSYVSDVLPSLGEDGVQLATLRSLVPEGPDAGAETSPQVASLKSSARLVAAVEQAVQYHERVPEGTVIVETQWGDLDLGPSDWAEALAAVEPGTTHNDARDVIWDALLELLLDRLDPDETPPHLLRRALLQSRELRSALNRAWPVLDPSGVVADLLSSPAYLRRTAPWLSDGEVQLLQRPEPRAWTVSDLPLLDAARQRIGDPEASRIRRRRAAELASQREEMSRVIEHLLHSRELDDGEGTLAMLRQESMQEALIDDSGTPALQPDELAGPFAHIVVDEAQELTDAEWQMLLSRNPSRSFTIVGDRAQAQAGFPESWQQRLERAGLSDVSIATLTINYRTPEEVMAEAEPVIRAVLPDANVPTSIRSSGIPVHHGALSDLDVLLADWSSTTEEGIACVIAGEGRTPHSARASRLDPRVRHLTPAQAKGLEFDLVILLEPDSWNPVDRYVAMTRATQRLVVLN